MLVPPPPNQISFLRLYHCECILFFVVDRSSGNRVSTGSNVGAIVSGVVGALLAIVILLILIVVILVIILKCRKNDVSNQGIVLAILQ